MKGKKDARMPQLQHEYGVRILKFMKSCQLNWCKLYLPEIHDDIASQQRWKQLAKAFSDAISFLRISSELFFSWGGQSTGVSALASFLQYPKSLHHSEVMGWLIWVLSPVAASKILHIVSAIFKISLKVGVRGVSQWRHVNIRLESVLWALLIPPLPMLVEEEGISQDHVIWIGAEMELELESLRAKHLLSWDFVTKLFFSLLIAVVT